jgi:SepF-like predicted cell division protein (DUF552 family)
VPRNGKVFVNAKRRSVLADLSKLAKEYNDLESEIVRRRREAEVATRQVTQAEHSQTRIQATLKGIAKDHGIQYVLVDTNKLMIVTESGITFKDLTVVRGT